MNIAITGGTGFIGRYIVRKLAAQGHVLRLWHREQSDRSGLEDCEDSITWQPGALGNQQAAAQLVADVDAVVHAALDHPAEGFQGKEGDLIEFVHTNLLGTLQLIEAARQAGVKRFLFVSTCAVHDVIMDDRPLDETHPLWMKSHYGAHKAAIEKFVHSYGLGEGFPICALRPTGVYGLAHPVERSKWYSLVHSVVHGEDVLCQRGGKEVHADDVANAIHLLLQAPLESITGQAFNCYDLYVSEWDVAHLAKAISKSDATIQGTQTSPNHQIETGKLRGLGMSFGGKQQLKETIEALVQAVQAR